MYGKEHRTNRGYLLGDLFFVQSQSIRHLGDKIQIWHIVSLALSLDVVNPMPCRADQKH